MARQISLCFQVSLLSLRCRWNANLHAVRFFLLSFRLRRAFPLLPRLRRQPLFTIVICGEKRDRGEKLALCTINESRELIASCPTHRRIARQEDQVGKRRLPPFPHNCSFSSSHRPGGFSSCLHVSKGLRFCRMSNAATELAKMTTRTTHHNVLSCFVHWKRKRYNKVDKGSLFQAQ